MKADEFTDDLGPLFAYEAWEPRSEWGDGAARGGNPLDNIDFHVDLGCGTIPKARIGVDRYRAPGVNVLADLNQCRTLAIPPAAGQDAGLDHPEGLLEGLPFPTSSIQSIISHHVLEHIGPGFLPLMQEVHRVLVPGGILRIIVPIFPSWSAVSDPDHCRYFMADPATGASSFDAFFVDDHGNSWLESFSVPYTGTAKFQPRGIDMTAPLPLEDQWTTRDSREMRIAMSAWKR